jgi:hypothetical protein
LERHDLRADDIGRRNRLTTTQMETEATFTEFGWNFASIWYMPSGSYPLLQAFKTQ